MAEATARARQGGDKAAAPDPCGLWNESWTLNRIDRALSAPIFHLELGLIFEVLLSYPGTFFGGPITGVGVGGLVICALATFEGGAEADSFAAAACLAVVLGGLWWAHLLRVSLAKSPDDYDQGGVVDLYSAGFAVKRIVLVFLFSPHVFLLLVQLFPHSDVVAKERRVASAVFYMSVWFASVAVCDGLKRSVRRMRPCFTLAEELRQVKRHVKQIQHMLCKKDNSHASFPSGDAAGAGAFAFCGLLFTSGDSWLHASPTSTGLGCLACGFLASFGRVFFHAHHVVDVTMGLLIALTMTTLGWGLCGGIDQILARSAWWHFATVQMGAFAIFAQGRRQKKAE